METKKVIGKPFNKGNTPWNKGLKDYNLGHPNYLKVQTKKTRLKIRKKLLGIKRSPETIEKVRQANLGSKSHLWGKVGFWKGKHRPNMMGEKHFNWKGGKGKELHRVRTSLEYKLWRESVFERDNYICQMCGKRGGDLEAHHIFPFSDFPELRFAINNGIALCLSCHAKMDKHRRLKGQKINGSN